MYRKIRETLRTRINSGEYAAGTAIPSENSLAASFDVARLTVRRAVDALVSEGLLLRVQGKGVYVVKPGTRQSLDLIASFVDRRHVAGQDLETRVLDRAIRAAGPYLARLMGIKAADEINVIRRLDLVDKEPVSLEETFVPVRRVPRLEGIDLSLFSLIEAFAFCGVRLSTAHVWLDVVPLEAHDARLLDVGEGAPAVMRSMLVRDTRHRIVEYSRVYDLASKASYSMTYHGEDNIDLA